MNFYECQTGLVRSGQAGQRLLFLFCLKLVQVKMFLEEKYLTSKLVFLQEYYSYILFKMLIFPITDINSEGNWRPRYFTEIYYYFFVSEPKEDYQLRSPEHPK